VSPGGRPGWPSTGDVVLDFLGPQVFDLFGLVLGYIGRPLQRQRATRLARRGMLNCVLSSPSNDSVLPTRVVTGSVEVLPGRLRLWEETDLWIKAIDLPGDAGPGERRHVSDLWFRPPSRIFTLHTYRGTVRLTVLEWQADWVINQLGFAQDPTESHTRRT